MRNIHVLFTTFEKYMYFYTYKYFMVQYLTVGNTFTKYTINCHDTKPNRYNDFKYENCIYTP